MTKILDFLTGMAHVAFYLAAFLLSATYLIVQTDLYFAVVFSMVMAVTVVATIETGNMRNGLTWLYSRVAIIGNSILALWVSFCHFNRDYLIETSGLDAEKVNHSALDTTYYIAAISSIIVLLTVITSFIKKKKICSDILKHKNKILENVKYLNESKEKWIETSGSELTVNILNEVEEIFGDNLKKYKRYDLTLKHYFLLERLIEDKETIDKAFILNRMDTKDGIKIKVNGKWITVPESIDFQ